MAIDRSAVKPADLPQELVLVEPIGGEVIVRGFDMPQLLAFLARRRSLVEPKDGESEDDARDRASAELVPWTLSRTVVLDDGLPVYTEAQWRAFAARHLVESMELFSIVMRLSGNDAEAEKKT